MTNKLSHCMCGCIYEELECPRCNKVTDKQRIEELEAKLAMAVGALGEAIYLLDPDEEDIAKKTGLHRIVTTYAELTGDNDE